MAAAKKKAEIVYTPSGPGRLSVQPNVLLSAEQHLQLPCLPTPSAAPHVWSWAH